MAAPVHGHLYVDMCIDMCDISMDLWLRRPAEQSITWRYGVDKWHGVVIATRLMLTPHTLQCITCIVCSVSTHMSVHISKPMSVHLSVHTSAHMSKRMSMHMSKHCTAHASFTPRRITFYRVAPHTLYVALSSPRIAHVKCIARVAVVAPSARPSIPAIPARVKTKTAGVLAGLKTKRYRLG